MCKRFGLLAHKVHFYKLKFYNCVLGIYNCSLKLKRYFCIKRLIQVSSICIKCSISSPRGQGSMGLRVHGSTGPPAQVSKGLCVHDWTHLETCCLCVLPGQQVNCDSKLRDQCKGTTCNRSAACRTPKQPRDTAHILSLFCRYECLPGCLERPGKVIGTGFYDMVNTRAVVAVKKC